MTIPLRSEDEWIKSYESITEMIVPRSSKKITEDGEYALYNITVRPQATINLQRNTGKII